MTINALPKPIADYIAANARLDASAMLKPFAPEAVVRDDGGAHEGRAGIMTWLQSAIMASEAIFTPQTVREEADQFVVEGMTAGKFKGSPLRFVFRFTIEKDHISALEISL